VKALPCQQHTHITSQNITMWKPQICLLKQYFFYCRSQFWTSPSIWSHQGTDHTSVQKNVIKSNKKTDLQLWSSIVTTLTFPFPTTYYCVFVHPTLPARAVPLEQKFCLHILSIVWSTYKIWNIISLMMALEIKSFSQHIIGTWHRLQSTYTLAASTVK